MNYEEIHLQVGDVGLAGAVEGGGGEGEERGADEEGERQRRGGVDQAEAQRLPSR